MKDFMELVKTRRSVRKFNDVPVDKEVLEQIVEAGRWAPTGGNSQSVHFTVLTDPEILQRLRVAAQNAFAAMEVTENMYVSMKNSVNASKKGNYIYDYNTKVLVVVSNKSDYPNAMADCACAAENMMLAATSFGVGSCWINQLHWLEENEEIRSILEECEISKDETICASVALGNYDMELHSIPRKGMQVTWK